MNNDNERLINKYLGFIIKHFNLTNETVDSLKKKFDYRFETKTRVSFKKNSYTKAQSLCRLVDRGAHAKVVDVLTRYADCDTFAEYMKNEGYKYENNFEGYLENIGANRFIVYPSENNDVVHNQLKKISSYDMWEFEKIDGTKGYRIAYN